jgi:hypothetical protein
MISWRVKVINLPWRPAVSVRGRTPKFRRPSLSPSSGNNESVRWWRKTKSADINNRFWRQKFFPQTLEFDSKLTCLPPKKVSSILCTKGTDLNELTVSVSQNIMETPESGLKDRAMSQLVTSKLVGWQRRQYETISCTIKWRIQIVILLYPETNA